MHYISKLPDIPTPGRPGEPLRTRRQALAQIVLCDGCCCGHTERGLPAVPLDYLKPIWKGERLNKIVQLSVSGCLGPCDLPNVATIVTPAGQTWYGRLTTREDYDVLVRWARRCREAGELVPLPGELDHLRFERWPVADDAAGGFVPIEQEPADIVLLTAADTEILTWSAAVRQLQNEFSEFPSVRALNIARLTDARVRDAYLDDVLQEAKVVVLRVLGGMSYFREGFEQIHLLAGSHGISLICLSGDEQFDPELAELATVDRSIVERVFRYVVAGGVGNAVQMLRFLGDSCLGTRFGWSEPKPQPEHGIYHPAADRVLTLAEWQSRVADSSRPTAAILFYRAHWTSGNLAAIDALVRTIEQNGMNALPVFFQSLQATDAGGRPAIFAKYFGTQYSVLSTQSRQSDSLTQPTHHSLLTTHVLPDVVITTTSFSVARFEHGEGTDTLETAFESLGVPVLQAIFASTSENVWAADSSGLSPRDVAMNVAIPEFDGRIITTAVSFKTVRRHDAALGTDMIVYEPRADRVTHVARLAARWARLRRLPNREKRVAVILANYPSKNARIGNAVGLDTPASLVRLLEAMRDAGFDLGDWLPRDGQELMNELIARASVDPEFAVDEELAAAPGRVSRDEYASWFAELPNTPRRRMTEQWGEANARQSADDSRQSEDFAVSGMFLGNIFLGIQPARGHGDDVSAIYHSPDLPPPHEYLAFYRWLRDVFAADAVIHFGKHGNLEWLPGKSLALSADCFPEAVLGELPNIYPYIINNPGEGTQAKRRSAAVIVDHLIPPMTRAETYGTLRELEHLVDEYYTVQSLDPSKAPLIAERIQELVAASRIDAEIGDRKWRVENGGSRIEDRESLRFASQSPILNPLSASDFDALLGRVSGYLCEIKESQIRDGLHVLGRLPDGEQLADLCVSLVRADNGDRLGITRSIALDLGIDFAGLIGDPAACVSQATVDRLAKYSVLRTEFSDLSTQHLAGDPSGASQARPVRTAGDAIDWLEQMAKRIVAPVIESLVKQSPARVDVATIARHHLECDGTFTTATLRFFAETIWPRLVRVSDEIDHVLRALDGRFVPPGASGAPTRGMANVLPTGRNFFSLDIRTIPTATAWRVGRAAAESLLTRHRERAGRFPESVAMVVWGTSNMRTGGDDIAQILALLGVRPRWQGDNARVVGVDVIPLAELGRPRIDVTVRMSGFFRDAFPNIVRLIDEAIDRVSRLDEPLDMNFIRSHVSREVTELASELGLDEAERRARFRIFSSPPGGYGAGLLPLIDSREWATDADLAEVYLNWGCCAYARMPLPLPLGEGTGSTRGAASHNGLEAVPARREFERRLARTDVVTQNQDNHEHDIFDSDDYFQFHGGMIAAVRSLTGRDPSAYLGDTSQPDRPKTRTLCEEACRVFHARVVNPKWLRGVMRHGYKGAVEMAATVDYLFGYDATTGVLDDWMYEELAARYLFDEHVQQFLREHNPWAERGMTERLLEAAERGLWENPHAATLDRLRQSFLASDAHLETVGSE